MKKNIFILAISISVITIFASCNDNFKEETKLNLTNNKTVVIQEEDNMFFLSSDRKSFLNSIDFDFYLFPDSYIIVKLSKDPSVCNYGFVTKDSELGKLLGNDIYSDEGTQYVIQFGPDTSKENFEKWADEMMEEGMIVICEKDSKGQYWGAAYTWEEWRNKNKK